MSVAAIVEHILKNDLRSTKEVQWNLNFPFFLGIAGTHTNCFGKLSKFEKQSGL